MPPSPRLPARMIRMAYLNETITISDQRITDTMPMMVSGESVRGACGLLESIERAGADIAVDDAECRESRGDGQLTRSNPGQRRRLKGSAHYCVPPDDCIIRRQNAWREDLPGCPRLALGRGRRCWCSHRRASDGFADGTWPDRRAPPGTSLD